MSSAVSGPAFSWMSTSMRVTVGRWLHLHTNKRSALCGICSIMTSHSDEKQCASANQVSLSYSDSVFPLGWNNNTVLLLLTMLSKPLKDPLDVLKNVLSQSSFSSHHSDTCTAPLWDHVFYKHLWKQGRAQKSCITFGVLTVWSFVSLFWNLQKTSKITLLTHARPSRIRFQTAHLASTNAGNPHILNHSHSINGVIFCGPKVIWGYLLKNDLQYVHLKYISKYVDCELILCLGKLWCKKKKELDPNNMLPVFQIVVYFWSSMDRQRMMEKIVISL